MSGCAGASWWTTGEAYLLGMCYSADLPYERMLGKIGRTVGACRTKASRLRRGLGDRARVAAFRRGVEAGRVWRGGGQ